VLFSTLLSVRSSVRGKNQVLLAYKMVGKGGRGLLLLECLDSRQRMQGSTVQSKQPMAEFLNESNCSVNSTQN
jgi:hypothetical protein